MNWAPRALRALAGGKKGERKAWLGRGSCSTAFPVASQSTMPASRIPTGSAARTSKRSSQSQYGGRRPGVRILKHGSQHCSDQLTFRRRGRGRYFCDVFIIQSLQFPIVMVLPPMITSAHKSKESGLCAGIEEL